MNQSKEPEVMENLIKQSQNGDMISFRDLITINQRFVFTVAFKVLCNEESAREVTQECFIKVWKNISLFNFKNKFTTWLYKITINICYDKLREKRSRNRLFVNYDDSESESIFHCENDISLQIENKELAKRGLKRMFLHAHSIAFNHPLTGEPLSISAPLPPELQKFLDKLGAIL